MYTESAGGHLSGYVNMSGIAGKENLAKKYGPRPSLAGGLEGSPKFQNPEATWPGRPRKGRALGRRLRKSIQLCATTHTSYFKFVLTKVVRD